MKETVLKYCFATCLTLLLFACKTDNRQITADMINFPPSSGEAGDRDIPVITFDSTECRFGTIAIGEKVNHTFRFKNTGKAPLLIAQVTPACGCTTPKDWSKEPILPGESGQISVEFNSTGFTGQIDKSISVLTNATPANWDLKLKGFVSGEEVDPNKYRYEMDMEVK